MAGKRRRYSAGDILFIAFALIVLAGASLMWALELTSGRM